MEKFKPKSRDELIALLERSTPLENIDVSMITDFSDLGPVFSRNYLTGIDMQGIETWDVSGAETMAGMFRGCYNFREDIGNWDVSRVMDLSAMFAWCPSFDRNLVSRWSIPSGANTLGMFFGCEPMDLDYFWEWV